MNTARSLAVLGGLTVLGTAWVTARLILHALEVLDAGLAYDIDNDPWEE